ncbi:MAG TPA: hypothetical protein ENN23_00120 [Deltaproteobacteria bacterium]|nr:hypothetical protein [Deltaproteobacteria bacterium]
MHLDWKKRNNPQFISDNQIRGIIALSMILAVIPFFYFFYLACSNFNYNLPKFSEQFADSISVEIVENEKTQGIYFISSGISSYQFFQEAGFETLPAEDFLLADGMRIVFKGEEREKEIIVSEMSAQHRIALGMRLDINKASREELIYVRGIGEATAKKIIELRERLGKFRDMEELTQIKGIKDKRVAGFRRYLYVDENDD